MNILTIAVVSLLALAVGRDGRAASIDERSALTKTVQTASPGVPTNGRAYHVRAGGPRTYVSLTNAPVSNLVAIAFASRGASDDPVVFRLTNREPHKVLVWNVRVQTKSRDGGTDGFGWDTIYDDYPVGTAKYNSTHYGPGQVGELSVKHPGATLWRVCVLYSIDWADSEKSYSGNYEVISQELRE